MIHLLDSLMTSFALSLFLSHRSVAGRSDRLSCAISTKAEKYNPSLPTPAAPAPTDCHERRKEKKKSEFVYCFSFLFDRQVEELGVDELLPGLNWVIQRCKESARQVWERGYRNFDFCFLFVCSHLIRVRERRDCRQQTAKFLVEGD